MTPTVLRTTAALCLSFVAALGDSRAAEPRPLRVAVLHFDSSADDPELKALGAGLQAMLTTDLASAPTIQLVERDKLAALKSELALSGTAAIDKTTAVKVGKLLGASHLLTGAVNVHAKLMRIDARLIDAVSGEVVLADKIEGDRELFFELEKALAQKLVEKLGAPLTPKERARLAKIHTADFDAFRRFSDGIEAFDQRAFDDARKALREALEKDAEFTLARLTLDDYEAIIAKLEARSELLVAGAVAEKSRARTARAAEQQVILKRLFELAQSQNDDERLAALFAIARWHNAREFHNDDNELHLVEDRFLTARRCDAFVRTYVAEAEKAFPKVPFFGTRDFIFTPPYKAEKYDEEQAHWLSRFFGTRSRQSEAQFRNELLEDIERGLSSREPARRLHLDTRDEARLAERAYKLGLKLDPDAVGAFFHKSRPKWWRESMSQTLGWRFREAGLFDESTRWYAEAGRAAAEPYQVEGAAREVAKNRDIVKLLAAHPSPRVREWMMLRGYDLPRESWERDAIEQLEAKVLTPHGRAFLANRREIRLSTDDPYMIIGDRPFYPAYSTFFSTGRRSDQLVAEDLDYYRGKTRSAAEDWWLGFFDGQHAGKLTARFAVRFAPDDEWWHDALSREKPDLAAAGYVDARPEMVFLFGLEDIDVPALKDEEKRGDERLQRGMRGFGLRILKDRVELVSVTQPEVKRGYTIERQRFDFEVLEAEEGAFKDGAKVSLTLSGKGVEAKVGGLSIDATLPRAPKGFTGFAFLRPGHVRIVAPQVTIPR